MIAALGLVYGFQVGRVENFSVEVKLKGWIPLFGGREGDALVKMNVQAKAVEPKVKGNLAVLATITDLDGNAFGAGLPVSTRNIDQFFPPSTTQFKPNGEVLENDAPVVKLPIRLPGLDSKRLAEISYLPLVLKVTPDKYSFERAFGESKMKYVVQAVDEKNESLIYKISLTQRADTFEDNFGNEVTESKATYKVLSALSGDGTATFDAKKAIFTLVKIQYTNKSELTPMKPGKRAKSRSLTTDLTVKHQNP
jgi:hypothetical protein